MQNQSNREITFDAQLKTALKSYFNECFGFALMRLMIG